MRTMTHDEWEATPADYRTERDDGTRAVLILDATHGTVLEDVEVLPDPACASDVTIYGAGSQ